MVAINTINAAKVGIHAMPAMRAMLCAVGVEIRLGCVTIGSIQFISCKVVL